MISEKEIKIRKRGMTLVEILIVIAIVAALAAIAITNLLRSRLLANDALAKSNLRIISTASEIYLSVEGSYPLAIDDLTTAVPAYLNRDFCTGNPAISGFTYSCDFFASDYTFLATPFMMRGSNPFTITTGGVWIP